MGNGRRRTWYKKYKRRQRWQAAKPWLIGVAVAAVVIAFVFAFAPRTPTIDPTLLAEEQARQAAATEERAAAKAAKEKAAEPLPPLTVEHPADLPLSVLFAGDSITVGHDARSPDLAFRGLIAGSLSEGGAVESAKIGNSSLTVSEVQPEADELGSAFDLVFVELGTNDVYKSEPERFAKDYPAFIQAIRATSPEAALVCAGVWKSDDTRARSLDRTIEETCTEAGGRFVPLQDIHADDANQDPAGTVLPDGSETDGAHPNDAGHKRIADALLSVIEVR